MSHTIIFTLRQQKRLRPNILVPWYCLGLVQLLSQFLLSLNFMASAWSIPYVGYASHEVYLAHITTFLGPTVSGLKLQKNLLLTVVSWNNTSWTVCFCNNVFEPSVPGSSSNNCFLPISVVQERTFQEVSVQEHITA